MIQFQYSLSEEDYLNYQLYTASKSKTVQAQKKRIRMLLTLVFLLLGGLQLLIGDSYIVGVVFIIVGIALYFLYPLRQKYFYKKTYSKFVKDQYGKKIGLVYDTIINKEQIESANENGKGIHYSHQFENLIELPAYLLLKLKTGEHFIFPKAQLDNPDELKSFLQSLEIPYIDELNWEWK